MLRFIDSKTKPVNDNGILRVPAPSSITQVPSIMAVRIAPCLKGLIDKHDIPSRLKVFPEIDFNTCDRLRDKPNLLKSAVDQFKSNFMEIPDYLKKPMEYFRANGATKVVFTFTLSYENEGVFVRIVGLIGNAPQFEVEEMPLIQFEKW